MSEQHADHCLPGMVPDAVQRIAPVVEQVRMARDTYRIRLRCPEIARRIVPGQFFMIRVPEETDPLLGRPFALYDIYEEDGEPAGVDFGYIVVGKLTRLMTRWKTGDAAEIWGPLGNGFPIPPAGPLMLVAGGIGQTPFLAVAREALGLRRYAGRATRRTAFQGRPPEMTNVENQMTKEFRMLNDERSATASSSGLRDSFDIHPATFDVSQRTALEGRPTVDSVTLCYGARSAEYLGGLDDFALPGLNVRTSTDDGTAGHHGFVTDLLRQSLDDNRPDAVYSCGPEPMMRAVAEICAAAGISCWLSLETPMACGFGACFSCVTKVRTGGNEWDYRRTCVEGPVFPAESLVL